MERGSSKHGARQDDALAKEVEGLVRGTGSTHAEEWKDPEPPADDDPELGPMRPQTTGQAMTDSGRISATRTSEIIRHWPDESREAAQLVIDRHGEPHEGTGSQLIWFNIGPWKRMIASRTFYEHNFPAPHTDSVESVIGYHVAPSKVAQLAEFDGSVVVERTAGEVSARCHDEEANFLALNLVDDIVTGQKTVGAAREYYAKEFLDARRNQPTPYMAGLRFDPDRGTAADPDTRALTDQDLARAASEGRHRNTG